MKSSEQIFEDLKELVVFWRKRAYEIQEKYGPTQPNITTHVVATFEGRADELEDYIKENDK